MPNRSQFDSDEDYRAWYREYRKKNREKFAEYERRYNLKTNYARQRKWDKAHPGRYKPKDT